MSGRRVSDERLARFLESRASAVEEHAQLETKLGRDLSDVRVELAQSKGHVRRLDKIITDAIGALPYPEPDEITCGSLADCITAVLASAKARADKAEAALAEALAANAAAERRGMEHAAFMLERKPMGHASREMRTMAARIRRAALPSPSDAASAASEVRL